MNKHTFADAVQACLQACDGDLLAATTIAKKYLLRDSDGFFVELSPGDKHARLAREFMRAEMKLNGNLNDPDEFYKRTLSLLSGYSKIVPQGSPQAALGNPFSLQSTSNCFVVDSPEDSMEGIFRTGLEIAEIQKRRGGAGVDISTLRPGGSRVNNAALVSTGITTFSDFFSFITRMVGQAGRQGALMVTCHCLHPEIEGFARMKQDLKKVTGANVSIKLTDSFMRAVESDEEVTLQWPVDVPLSEAVVKKVVKARQIWDTIIDCAWNSGEPGLLMWDTYCKYLPADYYPTFKTLSTNPCAELGLNPYDSCRLISNHLPGWVTDPFTPDAKFDFVGYMRDCGFAQRLSDNLVELELEQVNKIRDTYARHSHGYQLWSRIHDAAYMGRRTGLGTHGLADVFLMKGLAYGSDESIELADAIYFAHKIASYNSSVELAQERGPFPAWSWKYDSQCPFIQGLPDYLKAKIKKYGRRNIANLTNAPTGTSAIQSRSSSGIEGVFRWVFDRYVKVTHLDIDLPVDRVDDMGDKWTRYRVVHPAVKRYFELSGKGFPLTQREIESFASAELAHLEIKRHLPGHFVTSDEVSPEAGVRLQGVVQSHIDHGVSRTINLPRGSTKDRVKTVYMEAWKCGLKGVTVYVDGSRDGVLVTGAASSSGDDERPESIHDIHAPKRPERLDAEIHHVKVRGKDWNVVVGFLGERPFEVFAGTSLDLPDPGSVESASIEKSGSHKYKLCVKTKDNETLVVKDLREIYDSHEQRVITRSVCRELRHGVPVEFICRDLQDNEGGMADFSSVLARVLKTYAKRVNLLVKRCPNCGGADFRPVDGCPTCTTCGYGKCS